MPPPPPASAVPQPATRAGFAGGQTHPVSAPARPRSPASFWRKLWTFTGPGYMVAVGYMDPGNWATDIAGGSRFGYDLLWVVLLSNLMAMLLQALAARLGIVTGLDLAQACRERYGPRTRFALWLLCELAIIACELAEVIGTAIAFQLLFGIPLVAGVCLTAVNVFIIMLLERRGIGWLQAGIVALMLVTALCLATELLLSQPHLREVASGLLPGTALLADPAMLYVAIGIVGATVMPHNLYLHSATVRAQDHGIAGKREAIRFATIDAILALSFACLVNAAILILAASAFNDRGHTQVTEIGEAYRLLSPVLGAGAASILFGVALLASGQNSAVTGTLAGQVVMEGFTNLRLPVWARRLASRLLAIVPAAIIAARSGAAGIGDLLILSQVLLSLQLPFAIVPLIRVTSDRGMMGELANSTLLKIFAWLVAVIIIGLNCKLLLDLVA